MSKARLSPEKKTLCAERTYAENVMQKEKRERKRRTKESKN